MQKCQNMSNNIKQIPIPLTYISWSKQRIKELKQYNLKYFIAILLLILTNLISLSILINNNLTADEVINQKIINEELIPIEELEAM